MMPNRQIGKPLPLCLKMRVILSDRFVLFGLIYTLPITILLAQPNSTALQSLQDLSTFVLPMIILLAFGLYFAFTRIKLIEHYDTITRCIYTDGISISNQGKGNMPSLMLRLTLEIPLKHERNPIFKYFYFINSPVCRNNYNYKVIFRKNDKKSMILLDTLPKNVRDYIEK